MSCLATNGPRLSKTKKRLLFLIILCQSHFLFSQTPQPENAALSTSEATPAIAAAKPVPPPCTKPAGDLFDIDDYNGPFNKVIARFSQKVEIKTVPSLRHRPHLRLCSMAAGEKFHLFLENSFEPVNFLGAAWAAGESQAENADSAFGQGAAGYGKRFGVALTDNVAGDFFQTFLYPALFRQDPRYYRLARGTVGQRLFHAAQHVFVAHSDSGQLMFNFSEWMGTASSKALSNVYHPGNERGFGTTAERTGVSIATDMGYDVLREFWPEITHALHLPFKARDYVRQGHNDPQPPQQTPAGRDGAATATGSASQPF
ncbi:MAG TPA: hypothetical protein VKZ53_18125 [Candidatus Angelobacter sp.]|nr:hypothetical protein [Candidatus Angelobacter sp.]